MKTCRICQKELPYSDFHKDRTKPDGHLHRCKSCVRIYMADLRSGIKLSKDEKIRRIMDAKQRGVLGEKEISQELLKTIGYDIDGELSVHEQFMIRHNLV